MRNIIIAIIIVALLGIGFFVLSKSNTGTKSTSTNSSSNSAKSTTTSQSNQPASDTVTITYSDNGFSPSTATLKTGGKLTVTNSSSQEVQFNSDPHPIHTDNLQLNIGSINPGESKTVTLTNTGDWGYHNHLDPSQTGRITVE